MRDTKTANDARRSGNRFAVLVNFAVFLSGVSFLIYEVAWSRMLSLVLGATVTAATAVLMSYMAGFGAGAWFWGRVSDRSSAPLKLMGLLSAAVGLLGFATRMLIPSLSKLYSVLPFESSDAVVFTLSCVILFGPAFFMGGILPTAVKLIVSGTSGFSKEIGSVYALNALGSATGGLFSGFFLLRVLGMSGTLIFSVSINMALAILLLALASRNAAKVNADPWRKAPVEAIADPLSVKRMRERALALAAVFVIGLCGLILQIVWIRIFKVYLSNTSYTFSLITSIVITGTFAGSWLYRTAANRIVNNSDALIWTVGATAVLVLAGVGLIMAAPRLILLPLHASLTSPLARIVFPPLLSSLLVVLPPSIAGGFVFPVACRLYSGVSNHLSREFGRVLMANTLGCVVGPAVAAFVMIPTVGVGASLLVVALILFLTALLLTLLGGLSAGKKASSWIFGVAICLILCAVIWGPQIRILPPSFSNAQREVLLYEETVDATIVIGRDRGAGTVSYVNNSAVIGTGYDAIKAVKMIGHLPFYSGLKCRRALVVGFGIGVTASTIASYGDVERIDCVELVPGLKDSAHLYRELNHDVIGDTRLRFYSGDGRHYLQRVTDKYDLISCDPTHPVLGSGDLYSREYFELCRDHLNPGGMVSQYLPLHNLRTEDFLGIIKTFYSVFPDATVWLGHSHAILIGSLLPMKIDFEEWKSRLAAGAPDPLFYKDPYHIASSYLFGGRVLESLPCGIRINTDDRSYLEFFDYKALEANCFHDNAEFLRKNRKGSDEFFFNIDDPAKMARFHEGVDQYMRCLIAYQRGDKKTALEHLQRATRINPENEEYPFLIRYYFAR